MLSRVTQLLKEFIEPLVESHAAFLVDINIRGDRGGRVLEVFIDTDNGVTTGKCAEVSRDISNILDRENIITDRYYLVVSSPGLDRPLKLLRQYRKNIGRDLRVRYRNPAGVHELVGQLVNMDEERIIIQPKNNSQQAVAFNEIIETKIVYGLK